MEKIFAKVSVTLSVAVLLSAPWAVFLGAKGMELFWASMLCGAALFVTARREFLSSPWSLLVGMILSWVLLGAGTHLLPEGHVFRHGTSQIGVSLQDMTRVRDLSYVSVVAFFLLRGLLVPRQESEEKKRSAESSYRAVCVPLRNLNRD